MRNADLHPGLRRRNPNFERFFMDDFFHPVYNPAQKVKNRTTPAFANIRKEENNYLIELAVPGFSKEEIQISLDGHTLIVKGSKSVEETAYIKQEFNFSNFERAFTLPKMADLNTIEASAQDGILSIKIYAVAEKPQVQIEVK
ncbi:MAG: Hsp20/alpha crystallin family protein [Chitinophagales bacterium]|nr:Hsp20/alpha crystallin family protein [Chitinophagales bacterium]